MHASEHLTAVQLLEFSAWIVSCSFFDISNSRAVHEGKLFREDVQPTLLFFLFSLTYRIMVPLMRTKASGLVPAPTKMPEIPLLRGFRASD